MPWSWALCLSPICDQGCVSTLWMWQPWVKLRSGVREVRDGAQGSGSKSTDDTVIPVTPWDEGGCWCISGLSLTLILNHCCIVWLFTYLGICEGLPHGQDVISYFWGKEKGSNLVIPTKKTPMHLMVDTFSVVRERGSGITCMHFPYIRQFGHGNTQEEMANSSCSANPLGLWSCRVKMAKTVLHSYTTEKYFHDFQNLSCSLRKLCVMKENSTV